jgi:hypothetical protein
MALRLSGLRIGAVPPVISGTDMGTMMDYEEYSPKEQLQLTVCQRLIAEKSYLSQEEIRRDLQERGLTPSASPPFHVCLNCSAS